MSAVSKNLFRMVLGLVVGFAVALILITVLTRLYGISAHPDEISNAAYEQMATDLKDKCPKLRSYAAKLYESDSRVTHKELKEFNKLCKIIERRNKKEYNI